MEMSLFPKRIVLFPIPRALSPMEMLLFPMVTIMFSLKSVLFPMTKELFQIERPICSMEIAMLIMVKALSSRKISTDQFHPNQFFLFFFSFFSILVAYLGI